MPRRVLGRRIVGLAGGALCAVALVACGSSGGSGSAGSGGKSAGEHSPVKVALVTLKIPGSDLLTGYNAGAQAAEKVINARGGFGGRKVSIVSCNSMLQAATASTCAHKTLAQHPVAMFGCDPTWTQAGQPIYTQEGVPGFICMNTTSDFKNKLLYGLAPGGWGVPLAMADYACKQPSVHRVAYLTVDLPNYLAGAAAIAKTLKACGKTVQHFTFPATATDVAPYVDKTANSKPDFVLLNPLAGPGVISIYQTFAQQGIPASHIMIIGPSATYSVLHQAKGAMDGTLVSGQFASWSDTSDPDVAAYLKAMKGSSVDPRDENVVTGYATMMFLYQAAKKIGFGHFDSASLVKFLQDRSNNGMHMPMGRAMTVPGPSGYANQLQPYAEVQEWKNGKLGVVTKHTNNGWINGY